MATIASMVAAQISCLKIIAELENVVTKLEYSSKIQDSLFEIAELIFTTDSIEEFYRQLHISIGRLTFANNFYIALQSEDAKYCILPYCVDEKDVVEKDERISLEGTPPSISGYVLRENKPLLVYTDQIEQMMKAEQIYIKGSLPKSWLGVPFGDDTLKGIVVVQSYVDGFMFTEKDKQLLMFVAKHIHNAIQRVKMRAELEFLALHDPLTQLPNRLLFSDRVEQAITRVHRNKTSSLAILFLDLDHFKTINDAFGHGVGDKLLVKVSERLTSVLPENAEVGYLGGDAFLVILVQSDHQEMPQLNTLSKDIIHKISQSYFVDGLTLDIGCSIGVALFPDFGLDAVTLIKNADMAVYQAKTAGRATYHFYDGEMGQRFARNVRIETRLRQGLLNEKLELHFQPKVDLMSERCVGMEALLRWEDEELGVVSPAEFVPIAERSGIILPLGDWVFEQAFRHIIEWQEQGITVPPIAINCSAAQLKRVDFLPKLMALLDKYKVDPSLLEIEVTESILIEDAESCAELLRQISRLGMKLAIDDFGTGYSSLSYLKNFPFHYVKIDQVFIRDIIEDDNNAALTKAIISLSHSLGLKVIAEGIDSNEQLALLREYGCDIGQGYLFSKALGARSMGSDPIMVALNEQEQHL